MKDASVSPLPSPTGGANDQYSWRLCWTCRPFVYSLLLTSGTKLITNIVRESACEEAALATMSFEAELQHKVNWNADFCPLKRR